MKSKSPSLLLYLKEQGVLDKSPFEIVEVKEKYRKEYLQRWHKERRKQTKDIRIRFSPDEYFRIYKKAKALGLCPTSYSKNVILIDNNNEIHIPNMIVLQEIVQKLGIAGMQALRNGGLDLYNQIDEIETTLIEYLTKK
ncbi:MAG: hypothetical protein SGJ00_06585 [bacterium]|nr:hypothetical protein [bacterium]